MKNQILIIVGTVLISLCIGFAIPKVMGGKVQGLRVDQEQLKKKAANQFEQEIQRMVEEDYEKRLNEQMRAQYMAAQEQFAVLTGNTAKKIEAEFNKEAERIINDATSTEAAKKQVLAELASLKEIQKSASGALTAADDGKKARADAAGASDGSIDSIIAANRDKIDDVDLQEGRILYNSIDAGYLAGLMENGLTPEEDAEMQAYLSSRFSGSEYGRAKELYYKYVYLLNEQ